MSPLRLWLADVLVLGGLAVLSLALYGIARMPTVHARVHAAGKAVVLGAFAVLSAALFQEDGKQISRAFLIGIFLLVTVPLSSHLIARAAYRQETNREEERRGRDR